jgi:BlaI family transcriptional regulator, penicillinase repressor
MSQLPGRDLSRRERQIMDVVYRLGRATAADITREMPDPPSHTAVRTTLRILEGKGQLRHEREGARYIYHPVRPRARASRSMLRHVVRTFFEGSAARTMATLLDLLPGDLSAAELDRLAEVIDEARRRSTP